MKGFFKMEKKEKTKASNKRVQKSGISSTVTIGQENAFDKVCDFLTDDEVGIVGIYGMGGVGKTTLMKKACYEFFTPSNFKVIWIVVSKTVNVDNIQKSLMEELKLSFLEKQDPQARGMKINEALFNRKDRVALLLDDIWEAIDLEQLGVARGRGLDTSKFKIIFTTRLEDVCLQMGPHQKMKVECLGQEESWALFKRNVGEKALNSHYGILGLAKEVAKECAGLPLALIVMGKAMACKTSLQAWEDALMSLRNCPSMICGVETTLFERLKFSYDNLENQVERECFLFCCMYPKNRKIDKDTLVGAWIGEGLLDIGYGTYHETCNRGHDIIDTLVAKSLLEAMKEKYRSKELIVKMHDVIRHMGLWIGSESNYFVHTNSLWLRGEEIAKRWNMARWIYVEDHNNDIPQKLDCPNLSSLHLCGGRIKISNTFLNSMNFMCKVKVLIIDDVEFKCPEIPASTFGLLVELRHLKIVGSNVSALPQDFGNLTKLLVLILVDNDDLTRLPTSIGGLCELRKLQISRCNQLRNLPSELGKLKKLEMVDVSAGVEVEIVNIFNQCAQLRKLHLDLQRPTTLSNDLLYNLKKLEELRLKFGLIIKKDTRWIEGLERLMSLRVLTMCGCPIAIGDELISAIGAMRQLRRLRIMCCEIDKLVIPGATDFLPQPEVLKIRKCYRLEKVHFRKMALQSLCILKIHGCDSLAHVVGLQHLLQLKELEIVNLMKFEEELITTNIDEHCSPSDVQMYPVCFPNLQRLCLGSLPSMKCICDDSVSFPSLSEFRLYKCPKLEKLPRGLMNENRMTPIISGEIVGTEEWWEGLEWELDDAFKPYLRPLFVDERDRPSLFTDDRFEDARLSLLSELEQRVKLFEDQSNAVPGTTTMQVLGVLPWGRCRRVIGSWELGQLLGSGSFGTVYEGISDDGFFFAVKEVSLVDQGAKAQQCIDQLEQEIALLSQFEHENIVQYPGTEKSFVWNDYFTILLEKLEMAKDCLMHSNAMGGIFPMANLLLELAGMCRTARVNVDKLNIISEEGEAATKLVLALAGVADEAKSIVYFIKDLYRTNSFLKEIQLLWLRSKMDKVCDKVNRIRQQALDAKLEVQIISNDLASVTTQRGELVLAAKHTPHARPDFDDAVYNIHGREDDESALINLLLSSGMSGEDNFVSIIAVSGNEGIGKTTIARALLKNHVIMQNFDLQSWVCLSDSSPDVYSVTKGLLEYATKEKCPRQMSLDEIQYRLQSMVHRKQCLFVVDDVGLERPSDLDNLLVPFKYCAQGSKLVVTLRNDKLGVARETDNFMTIYQLQPLAADSWWMLFMSKRLPPEPFYFYQYEQFRKITRDVITKCRGVPLVVKILVGILQDQDIKTWERVLIDESWYSTQVEEGIPNAWRLIYGHLPGHLKPCLEYVSLFPNDYSVSRNTLLSLWIAEGFVGPYDDYSAMFSSAAEIFDQLEHRHLIDKDIRMHNLVRELLCLVCSRSYCHSQMGQQDPATCTAENITHASILGSKIDPTDTIKWLVQAKGLHTVFVKFRPNEFVCSNFLENWKLLRVISLSEADEMVLPPSIGDLQELRYLGLHMCGITSLPDSICRLSNLQTLELESCAGLVSLPEKFGCLSSLSRLNLGKTGICSLPYSFYDLTNLWDLNISETGISFLSDSISKLTRLEKLHIHLCPLSGMPRQFGSLTQLRHLSDYSVGDGKTWSGISELKGLNMLEGSLCISRLENIGTEEEAVAADLEGKKGLSELTLQWSIYSPVNALTFGEEHDLIIAQSLQPPRDVESVSFLDYAGDTFPTWSLNLEDCFPFLHSVILRGCVRVSTFNLPSMKMRRIEIQDCPQLDSLNLPKGEMYSTNLEMKIDELIIVDCPNLVSIPVSRLRIQRNFQVQGCNRLQINLGTLVNDMLNLESLELLNVQCDGTHLTFKELRVLGNLKLSSLPAGIRSLQSLQVVELNDCPLLKSIQDYGLPRNTRKLRITACPLFEHLPVTMRGLTYLKSLKLHDLPQLLGLPSYAIPANIFKLHVNNCGIYEIGFPTLRVQSLIFLQVLHIYDCPNLKRITADKELPDNLAELVVHDCQSLEFLTYEGIHNLTNLQTLQITNCGKLSLSSDSLLGLTSLKELRVDYISIMQSGLPPALEKLKLWGHENLHSFPQQEWLQNLPSIQRLKIAEFPQLQFLPTKLPSTIQHLSICDCPALTIIPEDMVVLMSLKKLKVMNCQLSESFCENGLPSTLVELKILNCEEIKHLPKNLNTLTCLESMTISSCPELKLRPEDKLPDNLTTLKITDCPKLALKGKEGASSSWNMDHIPFRYIS